MVKFNAIITLYEVLFVPTLTWNLVSILQLTNDLVPVVTFTPKLCVLHDHFIRKPIEVGAKGRGVYLFKEHSSRKEEINKMNTCDM